VKVAWEAGGKGGHELTGAYTPQLAGTCHLAITYGGAHIQGAATLSPQSQHVAVRCQEQSNKVCTISMLKWAAPAVNTTAKPLTDLPSHLRL